MEERELSVDDYLAGRGRQEKWLATLEPVDGDDTAIRISPLIGGAGCTCRLAIRVARSAIAAVRETDQRHQCCGRLLDVVEVRFADNATIPLRDLFAQLGESGRV